MASKRISIRTMAAVMAAMAGFTSELDAKSNRALARSAARRPGPQAHTPHKQMYKNKYRMCGCNSGKLARECCGK